MQWSGRRLSTGNIVMAKQKLFGFKFEIFGHVEPKKTSGSSGPEPKTAKASEQAKEPKAIDFVEWTRDFMREGKKKP